MGSCTHSPGPHCSLFVYFWNQVCCRLLFHSLSRRSLPAPCLTLHALCSPCLPAPAVRYVLWIPDEHYLNILQPFIHIVLVERVTHEHHTVPPRLDVNNKWSFLARVRWWLIAAWVREQCLLDSRLARLQELTHTFWRAAAVVASLCMSVSVYRSCGVVTLQ